MIWISASSLMSSSSFLVILVVVLSCCNVQAEEPSSPTTGTGTPATFGTDAEKEYSELICGGNTYCQSALSATRQFLNVLGQELLNLKIPNFLNANDDDVEEAPPTIPPQTPEGIKVVDDEIPVVTEYIPETVSEPEPVILPVPVRNQEPEPTTENVPITETETKAEPLEIENELDTGKSVLETETEPIPSSTPVVPVPVPAQEPVVVDPTETVSKPPQIPTETETVQHGQEKYVDQNVYEPLSTSTLTETEAETETEEGTVINVRVIRDGGYYNTNGGEGYEEDYINNFNINPENQDHEKHHTDGPQVQQPLQQEDQNGNQNQAQQNYDGQMSRDTISPEIIININYGENAEDVQSKINDLGRGFEKWAQYLEPQASLGEGTQFEPRLNSAENYISENEAQTYSADAQGQDEDRLETRAQTEDQFPTSAQTQTHDQLSTHAQTETEDQFSTYAQTHTQDQYEAQESIKSQQLPPVDNNVPTEATGQNPTTAPVPPPLVQPEPQVAFYETEDDYYDPETGTTQEQQETGTHAQDEFEDDYDDDDEEDLTELPRIPSHDSYAHIPRERDPRVEL